MLQQFEHITDKSMHGTRIKSEGINHRKSSYSGITFLKTTLLMTDVETMC